MGKKSKERAVYRSAVWSAKEDKLLKQLVNKDGVRQWVEKAKHIEGKTAKQCCNRWHESLDPNLKKGRWNIEEDKQILQMYSKLGQKWNMISNSLNRAALDVKNRFYALKRKCTSNATINSILNKDNILACKENAKETLTNGGNSVEGFHKLIANANTIESESTKSCVEVPLATLDHHTASLTRSSSSLLPPLSINEKFKYSQLNYYSQSIQLRSTDDQTHNPSTLSQMQVVHASNTYTKPCGIQQSHPNYQDLLVANSVKSSVQVTQGSVSTHDVLPEMSEMETNATNNKDNLALPKEQQLLQKALPYDMTFKDYSSYVPFTFSSSTSIASKATCTIVDTTEQHEQAHKVSTYKNCIADESQYNLQHGFPACYYTHNPLLVGNDVNDDNEKINDSYTFAPSQLISTLNPYISTRINYNHNAYLIDQNWFFMHGYPLSPAQYSSNYHHSASLPLHELQLSSNVIDHEMYFMNGFPVSNVSNEQTQIIVKDELEQYILQQKALKRRR